MLAVNRTKVAILIGPLVPDCHLVIAQISNVGIAGQEPQKLMNDGAQMQLLGRDERKPFGQVKPHLVSENRFGAGAGPVHAGDTGVQDMVQKIMIGAQSHLHPVNKKARRPKWAARIHLS